MTRGTGNRLCIRSPPAPPAEFPDGFLVISLQDFHNQWELFLGVSYRLETHAIVLDLSLVCFSGGLQCSSCD